MKRSDMMSIEYIAEIKTWRDRINGVSYFSARVYDLNRNLLKAIPFQNGYGDHPKDTCIAWIDGMNETHQHKFELSKKIYFNQQKSTKKECVAFGKGE